MAGLPSGAGFPPAELHDLARPHEYPVPGIRSVQMASQRIRDAFAVEADVLVSACPACKDNLRKGMKNIPKGERRKLKIMDLTEVVSAAL